MEKDREPRLFEIWVFSESWPRSLFDLHLAAENVVTSTCVCPEGKTKSKCSNDRVRSPKHSSRNDMCLQTVINLQCFLHITNVPSPNFNSSWVHHTYTIHINWIITSVLMSSWPCLAASVSVWVCEGECDNCCDVLWWLKCINPKMLHCSSQRKLQCLSGCGEVVHLVNGSTPLHQKREKHIAMIRMFSGWIVTRSFISRVISRSQYDSLSQGFIYLLYGFAFIIQREAVIDFLNEFAEWIASGCKALEKI